jgi:pimeloyl-ACP methyl ester carboxylesterase
LDPALSPGGRWALALFLALGCRAHAGLAGGPEALSFTSSDGLRLWGDLYPGRQQGPSTLLLLAPGFSQNKATRSMRQLCEALTSTADVLILDFRGTGKSQGVYCFGGREDMDLVAALEWARPRYARVAVMGLSLGAYIAGRSASQRPELADLLLLVSPPTSVEEIVWDGGFLWQPLCLLFGPRQAEAIQGQNDPFFRWGPVFLPKPNLQKLAPGMNTPADFLLGAEDNLIFARQSRKVFEAYGGPKTLAVLGDGGHAEHMFLQHPDFFIRWAGRSLGRN